MPTGTGYASGNFSGAGSNFSSSLSQGAAEDAVGNIAAEAGIDAIANIGGGAAGGGMWGVIAGLVESGLNLGSSIVNANAQDQYFLESSRPPTIGGNQYLQGLASQATQRTSNSWMWLVGFLAAIGAAVVIFKK